jgi:SAM-dependent methyltransferase
VVTKKLKELKLDIGCGSKKREGFHGVDQYKMAGVDTVLDVRAREPVFANSHDPSKPHGGNFKKWPWKDNSVDEIHCSHFLEHLTATERIHFYNEAYRVMKPGAKATIITPHWCGNRAYGDPTHQWPPVSEMSFYYLKQAWRITEAPHTDAKWNPNGYSCNFEGTWGYSYTQELSMKAQEHIQFALQNYKDAVQDMIATLTKPMG